MGTVWTEKDENWKRVSLRFFKFVVIICHKYLKALMITKRSKVHVSYLYTWMKYKSITVYIENKTGGGA